MAQDNSYINLDAQQQLVDDELRKAKARRDAEMIAKAKEDYENLMKFNYTQDPRNQRVEMKPRKEYTHFEDNLPGSGELLYLLNNDPEAVKFFAEQYRNKASKNIADKEAKAIAEGESNIGKYTDPLSREDRKAISSENMFGYRPSNFKVEYPRPKEEEPDVDEELAKAASFNAIDSMKRAHARDVHGKPINPSGIIAYQTDNPYVPESTVQDNNTKNIEETKVEQKPEEPKEEEQFYLKYITPQVNEALKAIADKDPSMLQLPEVKALMERSKIAYGKQNDLLSIAPWTSNPDQTVQVANALREQGDKNLMDAAANLESIRDRQLDATKAMADDLTRQKGNLVSLHGQVLGQEAAITQVVAPAVQAAYELELQSEAVHQQGDNAVGAAIAQMKNFVANRMRQMGVKASDLNMLNAELDKLNPANIKDFVNKVRGISPNKNMRKEYNEELNAISKAVADYESAMVSAKKLKDQAELYGAKARGLMGSASRLGEAYHIPDWAGDILKINNPSGNIAPGGEVITAPETQVQVQDANPNPNPNPPPPPQQDEKIEFDPFDLTGMLKSNLTNDQIANNVYEIAKAYATKSSNSAKVHIYKTEKDAEGNDVQGAVDLALTKPAERARAIAVSLAEKASKPTNTSDHKRAYAILKSLYNKGEAQYDALMNSLPKDSDNRATLDALKGQFRTGAMVRPGSKALEEQYAYIQDLLPLSGYIG